LRGRDRRIKLAVMEHPLEYDDGADIADLVVDEEILRRGFLAEKCAAILAYGESRKIPFKTIASIEAQLSEGRDLSAKQLDHIEKVFIGFKLFVSDEETLIHQEREILDEFFADHQD